MKIMPSLIRIYIYIYIYIYILCICLFAVVQSESNFSHKSEPTRAKFHALPNWLKILKHCRIGRKHKVGEMDWPGGQNVGRPQESIFKLSRASQRPYN